MAGNKQSEQGRRRVMRIRRMVEERWRSARASVICLLIVCALAVPCLAWSAQPKAHASGERSACSAAQGTVSGAAMASDTETRGGYVAVESALGNTCHAMLDWPLRKPVSMLRAYDGPAQPWLSGHRGVDLKTMPGEELLAPGDGVISFAGKVAGKDVVSMKHGELILTFEPAVTQSFVGASVRRGERFATVGEQSDHCDDVCLHWGIRSGKQSYLDPASMVSPYRIVLKPAR
ncbi:M23 family metallopeptidase [Bifidobacterium merycicum]|uniref:Peptidase, M23 family n=1 Tax=Bifidobacterium merycicum TaxID=78345 RepID=A0A087BIM3_9BIFI|nr:M23 family metallopeptidase [Bifidobacterium merycicum]KFI70873.1 peptidase, M23 family [Bifidobacterium merycicum]MEE1294256.1 M23 family metallopeptidase [Bifidobacterium merycicum]SHE34833.1 Membrane proteins related to metalloendopeptidases [Bifidobacterium merycicum DSM 6492]